MSNHVVCGPGNPKAIEILFLDDGRSSPLIRACSRYCDCAGAARPGFSARDARRSPDDEFKVPDARSVELCSALTNLGQGDQRLIIKCDRDVVAAVDLLSQRTSRGRGLCPDLACTS